MRLEKVLALKLKAVKGQKLPALKRGDVARYFPSSGKATPFPFWLTSTRNYYSYYRYDKYVYSIPMCESR